MHKILTSLLLLFLLTTIPSYSVEREPNWVIARGERDRDRLTILNELYNPHSLSALKIAPGMKILTVGCGTALLEIEIAKATGIRGSVIATDISGEQLKIALQNCRDARLENVRLIQLDAINISEIPVQFDRVHCRFVLSHFPWEKILQIVPILYEKVAPGGLLVLEEIATLETLCCKPHTDPGYAMWKLCFEKQFALQQSDPSPGNRLHEYLKEEGYQVSYSSHQPVLMNQREKAILSMGVKSVAEKLLRDQFFTSEEIREMVILLEKLEQDPTLFPAYVEASQITVQKPF